MEQREKSWADYVPSSTYLYYVDRNDGLNNQVQTLQECITTNEWYPITEKIDEWWDSPDSYELEQIEEAMFKDGKQDLFEEHYDEIRELIWERDISTPLKDLLGNTYLNAFYTIAEPDYQWGMDAEKTAREIREIFGIKEGTPEAEEILLMVEESGYGGELRIYFEADFQKIVNQKSKEEDYKQIRFNGEIALAFYNSTVGSGWYCIIRVDKAFPFNRENLFLSKCDSYYLEDCFGMVSNCFRDCAEPEFSYEPLTAEETMPTASTSLKVQREIEYEKAYRAGGCTFGDIKYSRHRDVYYINDFPCGSKCPHCGQFWID